MDVANTIASVTVGDPMKILTILFMTILSSTAIAQSIGNENAGKLDPNRLISKSLISFDYDSWFEKLSVKDAGG